MKEEVYLPDWLDDERLAYTDRLADAARRAPARRAGSRAASAPCPGAFKARVRDAADEARIADLMLRHAAGLHRAPRAHRQDVVARARARAVLPPRDHRRDGALLRGATSSRRRRWPRFGRAHRPRRAARRGGAPSPPRRVPRRLPHGGRVRGPGGRRSAALAARRHPRSGRSSSARACASGSDPGDRRSWPRSGPSPRASTCTRSSSAATAGSTRYLDLPEALAAAARDGGGAREWRIHFHVPLFREELGAVREHAGLPPRAARRSSATRPDTPHLEVETYTWDVLPEEYRARGHRDRGGARAALGARPARRRT